MTRVPLSTPLSKLRTGNIVTESLDSTYLDWKNKLARARGIPFLKGLLQTKEELRPMIIQSSQGLLWLPENLWVGSHCVTWGSSAWQWWKLCQTRKDYTGKGRISRATKLKASLVVKSLKWSFTICQISQNFRSLKKLFKPSLMLNFQWVYPKVAGLE